MSNYTRVENSLFEIDSYNHVEGQDGVIVVVTTNRMEEGLLRRNNSSSIIRVLLTLLLVVVTASVLLVLLTFHHSTSHNNSPTDPIALPDNNNNDDVIYYHEEGFDLLDLGDKCKHLFDDSQMMDANHDDDDDGFNFSHVVEPIMKQELSIDSEQALAQTRQHFQKVASDSCEFTHAACALGKELQLQIQCLMMETFGECPGWCNIDLDLCDFLEDDLPSIHVDVSEIVINATARMQDALMLQDGGSRNASQLEYKIATSVYEQVIELCNKNNKFHKTGIELAKAFVECQLLETYNASYVVETSHNAITGIHESLVDYRPLADNLVQKCHDCGYGILTCTWTDRFNLCIGKDVDVSP